MILDEDQPGPFPGSEQLKPALGAKMTGALKVAPKGTS
jgi:hypothetical protein